MAAAYSYQHWKSVFQRGACTLLVGTLSLPALAHEDHSLPFRQAPAVVKASLILGISGFVLLIGLLVYRASLSRANRRAGAAEDASPRWFSRTLLSLLLLTATAGVTFSFAQRTLNAAAQEQQALHGNEEDATLALNDVLETMTEERQIPLLIEYSRAVSPGLRLAAVNALGELHRADTADTFEQAFRDSSASVRERGLELLTDVAPQHSVPLLLAALKDEDTLIREAALRKILLLSSKKAADLDRSIARLLIPMLDDSSSHVTLPATKALSKLIGKNWQAKMTMSEQERAAVFTQWRNWWQNAQKSWPTSPEVTAASPIFPERRDPAPSFQITDIAGKPFDLAGQRGRVTLLNFWGTWCPPCQQEIPDLKKVDKAFRERGVDLIGLALSEPEGAEGVRRFCEKQGVLYRQALCPRSVQRDYGEVTEVPVTILIDKKGEIRQRWEGPRDFATFRATLERILQEP